VARYTLDHTTLVIPASSSGYPLRLPGVVIDVSPRNGANDEFSSSVAS